MNWNKNIRWEKYGQKLRPRTKYNCELLYSSVVQRCMWSVQAKDRRIRSRSSWSIVPWLPEIRHEIKFDGMWVVVASLLSRHPTANDDIDAHKHPPPRHRRCRHWLYSCKSHGTGYFRIILSIVQINGHLKISKKKKKKVFHLNFKN